MTEESAESNPQQSHPSGAVGEKFKLLMELLRELFQLDKGDLDFGLYRVMNMKAAEIEAFLTTDLLPQAKSGLSRLKADLVESLESELAREIANLKRVGQDNETIEKTPLIVELRAKHKSAAEDAATEGHVYNHLYQFFSRYYDSGDFMSLRRMRANGDTSYLIPYNGEEVKLHWANADQYYIKTAENFASYIFGHENWPKNAKVRFEVAAADAEKDNIKADSGKDRRFLLTTREGQSPLTADGDQLVIYFDHRPLTETEAAALPGKNNVQPQLNEETQASILRLATKLDPVWAQSLAQPAPTDCEPGRTVLAKHLAVYTAKNSFDYFIHKDLRGFLRRELDLYLKTEIMTLDDFDPDCVESGARLSRVLVLMSAVRSLGGKIIDFLAQLEDFHKSIWLKKKFVLETNYGVTLDKVPESLHEEISANEAQVREWIELYALDKTADFANPLSASFLHDNPHMVVDTRHFDQDFIDRLLTALADGEAPVALDDDLDGLLVHGENFQALNLLQTRYASEIQCIYIDPPFNTDASPILYKNGYKSSAWMSLMQNRLQACRSFLLEKGVLVAAIDDQQYRELNFLLSEIFGELMLGTILVRSNPSGRPTQTGYSVSHEYLIYSGKSSDSSIGRLPPSESQMSRFSETDEEGPFEWRNLRREGSNSDRSARRHLYYPIFIGSQVARVPRMTWEPSKEEWIVEEEPRPGETVIFPNNEDGVEKTWRWGWEKVMRSLGEISIRKDRSGQDFVYYKRRPHDDGVVSTSCWFDAKYSAVEHGTALIKKLFGKSVFSYPKSVFAVMDSILVAGAQQDHSCILDFFAGSGTTAHAVMNLNRDDGGSRKYIMVEMGHHFETVLLPRIKKIAYSHDWKDSKPVSRKGQSHFFKYIKLESHEDALDSLEVKPLQDAGDLFAANPELAEDYALRYQLSHETSSSASLCGGDFTRPNGYTLSVVRDGARRDVAVDLPETFNFLIGLRVHARRVVDKVLVITGIDAQETRCLILWRDIETTGNDALNAWFQTHGERILTEFNASLVYVNGDHELGRLTPSSGAWTTGALELVFREKMFAVEVE